MDADAVRRMAADYGVLHNDQLPPSTFLKVLRMLTQDKCSEQELTEVFLDLTPCEIRRQLVLRKYNDLDQMSEYADVVARQVNFRREDQMKFLLGNASQRVNNEERKKKISHSETQEDCDFKKKRPKTDDDSENKS